jgi:anti-anti-sigma factor
MQLETLEEENGITRLVLTGRMDIAGALAVDDQFKSVAGTKKKLIVDLANVDFLASLGMRTLVSTAKQLSQERGKMVIANPQRNVEEALKTAGIDTIIPVVADLQSANALLR